MKTLLKKATGGLLLAVLLLLASCSGISSVWSPGVITAEAATKKVALSKKSATLAVGGKTTIQLKNINTKKSVSWSSSNKKVATVKKGSKGKATITAKKAGSATITVKYGGKKYKIKVKVKGKSKSSGSSTLKLYTSDSSIREGRSAIVKLNNPVKGKKITWKSSNSKIAKIKYAGNYNNEVTIIGMKAGTVTITATHNGKKYTCKITVRPISYEVDLDSMHPNERGMYTGKPFLSGSPGTGEATIRMGGATYYHLSNAIDGINTKVYIADTSVAVVNSIEEDRKSKLYITYPEGDDQIVDTVEDEYSIMGLKPGETTVTVVHGKYTFKYKLKVIAQLL